jgi:hypothetical protein
MGQNDPDIQIEIKTTGAAQAKKDIKEIANAGEDLGKQFKEAGGGVKGLVSALTGGASAKIASTLAQVTSVFASLTKAIHEFGGAEKSILKLQASLAQNGLLTEKVNAEYQELASTLQEITGKADEQWIDVLNRLTQFGARPEDIQKHVAAVKNLAGILGGDLEGAAIGVSKAMEGQFDMFARWGIHVDEAGTKAEKLDQLYKQLAQKGTGQLEAATNSLDGHFRRLGNSVNDVFKALGQKISDTGALQFTLYGLGKSLKWVADRMSDTVPVADAMQNAVSRSSKTMVDAERYNKNYADSLKDIHDFATAVGNALQNQINKMEQIARIRDEQTDAQMAQDLAIVDREEKLGRLSPDQAIRARATVRTRSEAEKFKRQQDLRTEQMLTLNKGITAGLDESDQYETAARDAEAEAKQAEAADLKKQKLNSELEYWKKQIQFLHREPAGFYNPELGIKPGFKGPTTMPRVEALLNEKLREAQDNLAGFDAQNPPTVGGTRGARERAKAAREEASKVIGTNYQNEVNMMLQMEQLQREKDSATRVYQIKSGTAGIEAGTEFALQRKEIADKAGLKTTPQVLQANTRAVQDEVMRGSQAFVGGLEQLGGTLETNFDHINAELSRLNKRIQLYEKQLDKQRNK